MSSFRENLGASESGGRYGVVNSEGYTGKYQFGPARLQDFMEANDVQFSMEQFRQSPVLQERVQDWHESDILAYFRDEDRGLSKYLGREVGGVLVTPESVIAMAHLGGKGGMRKFLESGGVYNPSDSNGTRLSDYGEKFAGTVTPDSSLRPRARPEGVTSVLAAASDSGATSVTQPQLAEKSLGKNFNALMAMYDEKRGGSFVRAPNLSVGRSGKTSPLSKLRLPGSDMIARNSVPGGIGTLKG